MSWNPNFQTDFEEFLKLKTPTKGQLADALLYALQSPGKRLRPRFAFEAGILVGLDSRAIQQFAFAIELVHLFSLIHDDLPCMDDDDFRRGQPTVHKKFGEATALLAGDALLSLASEAFLETAAFVEAAAFAKGYRFFLQAIGPEGMIGGQSQELEIISSPGLAELLKIQDLKTGALFRAALLVPFLLKGISETDSLFQEVKQYASDFGFAFQIADDLEDEAQDLADERKNILSLMGKTKAQDLARARLTQTQVSTQFGATQVLLQKLR